jgi:hypothetical protein
MKDAEEHKFAWVGRLDLLFLSNANAFREQGGAIFADWEALSRCAVWMEKSAANMARGMYHEDFRSATNGH